MTEHIQFIDTWYRLRHGFHRRSGDAWVAAWYAYLWDELLEHGGDVY